MRKLADLLHRWIAKNRTRVSNPATSSADLQKEKIKQLASAIGNPNGPVEDYVEKFKALIDEVIKPKPVTFFTPEMMTESGAKSFDDPRLGKVANARVKAMSWLIGDGKGGWKTKDLGRGPQCRANFQREVASVFEANDKRLQMESYRKRNEALNEGRQVESEWWGNAPDSANWDWGTFRSSTTLEKDLPYPPGPFTKQMYLQDMWKLDSLVFQFCNYSGLAKRALAIKAAYILGNGIKIDFEDDDLQTKWDQFEDEVGFYGICLVWILQWFKYGELNINPWILPNQKLRVRSIDRDTIWDTVTNPEDIFDIHGYWVQFTTQYQLFTKGADGVNVPYTEYIMRMMPPESIIQLKRNVDENEKRGRSDLIAAMAIISYYDDTVRALVMRTMMEASWVWDVEVGFGDQTDVDSEAQKESNFPKPGATFFHTQSIKRTLSGMEGAKASGKSGATQEILGAFAVASGVPEEFFGMAGQSNKAAALTGTAPFVKQTQVDQKLFEVGLRKLVNFWLEGIGKHGSKFECIFPEIAPADMFTKIQAIVLAQTSGYYSVERAATMTAKELNDTTYTYNDEKAAMDNEKAAQLTDPATEQSLYPSGQGGHPAPTGDTPPATPGQPTQPKKVAIPGAGLPKLPDKVVGPPGADSQLDSSGVGS